MICAIVIAAIGFGTSPRSVSAASSKLSTFSDGKPSCPVTIYVDGQKDKTCYVNFWVTGFQEKAKGRKNPFVVKQDGKIVAWSVKVGKPTKAMRKAGAAAYGTTGQGGHPAVRLAVLAKVPNKKNTYRLARQSPIAKLHKHYGTQPVFTLGKPLTVKKGQIVALSVWTWSPTMTNYNYTRNSAWRASANNNNGNCKKAGRQGYKVSPQKKVNSKRQYACKFNDLLLYSAQIVPKASTSAADVEPVTLSSIPEDE